MFCKLLWSAALSFPRVVSAVSQQPLTIPMAHNTTPGTLRRFTGEYDISLADVLRIAQEYDLDTWQTAATPVPHVDIYSPPGYSDLPSALAAAPHTMMNLSVPLPGLLSSLRPAHAATWDLGLEHLKNTAFHDAYHPQWEIDAFLHELAHRYPEQVRILRLGHSAEEREMLGVRISKSLSDQDGGASKKKLGFIVLGPQHAREWVATSSALYIAHALLVNASETGSLAALLEAYDFHIIPSPNPDGYVYTWESDRFWYKNRQIVGPGAKCIGIDMNRNWGAHWKPHSDSPLLLPSLEKKKNKEPADPCSHWYPGHRPFEAAEVNNLANYITKVNGVGKGAGKGGVVGFVELRSYGQMLAAPYSYKCDKLPKDAEDQMEALLGSAQAGRSVHGTSFSVGTLCSLLYSAPGNILDYVYASAKGASIKYAYSAFLRDTGTYGFALPPEWIRPVGEETGAMIQYLAKFVAEQRGVKVPIEL